MKGPLQLDPKGLYPLMPFTQPLGGQLPVYTSPKTWEDCIKHDPIGICHAMYRAIEGALTCARADKPTIEFKAWLPAEPGKKSKRVRLSATLYQMTESQQVWVELKQAPVRSKHGRFRG